MELFLVRHGQTRANADGIIQGWLDTELNEVGLKQAEDAAAAFTHDVDMIVSSDLARCVRTAIPFRAKYPDVPYHEDVRLRERNFGDAQGTHRDNHDWEAFWASNDSVTIPHAETLDAFNGRVRAFLTDTQASLARSVLVITHGGTINRISDLTSDGHVFTPHKNAGVTRIVL